MPVSTMFACDCLLQMVFESAKHLGHFNRVAWLLPWISTLKPGHVPGVNMPVHFINKWQEGKQELFIDCFNHGCIMHRYHQSFDLRPAHMAPFPVW